MGEIYFGQLCGGKKIITNFDFKKSTIFTWLIILNPFGLLKKEKFF